MEMLISKDDFNMLASRALVPCRCLNCQNKFSQSKNIIQRAIKGTKKCNFCSKKCAGQYKTFNSKVECLCKNCGKKFFKFAHVVDRGRKIGYRNLFCSQDCANSFNGKQFRTVKPLCSCGRRLYKSKSCFKCLNELKYINYIRKWRNGEEKGWSGRPDLPIVSSYLRRFLFEKYNNKCCKCGWSEKNQFTNRIPLQINHIDGQADNCSENNLELICPNCHSLTHNFGSRNKGSVRKRRRFYNQ